MSRRKLALPLLLAATVALPALAFDLQGHRGARGLRPENTLAAFSFALATGVTTLETDLAVTKDGVLVISHDPFLNPDLVRTPDGRWLGGKGPPIHTLTLAELKRYDIGRLDPSTAYARQFPEQRAEDGERFPTLAEVFALVKARSRPARLNIETKITPGQRVRDRRCRYVRAADRRCHSGRRARRRSDDPVVRLANARRREEAGAGHRDGLPHDRNRGQRHRPARVGQAFSVARRAGSSRLRQARCRASSRPRAAAPGRRSGAT